MRKKIDGILLLDKPKDLTSHQALQKVKKLFNAKKVGHTGSLDPIATGMLPLCFGEATKFSQFLLESNKFYQFTAKLGEETDTGDSEGKILATTSNVNLSEEEIVTALQNFVGEIDQIPPMFSALKHKGQPLYKYARRGIHIERPARRVRIFSLFLEKFTKFELTLKIHCSKGTYIRSLASDLGRTLGCGAHVTSLRRISVTPYANEKMYTFPSLEEIYASTGMEGLNSCLLPIESALELFPAVKLSAAAAFYLRKGQAVRAPFEIGSSLVRLLSEDAKFIGIGQILSDGRVKPHRLLA